jgi:hypothetical protein
MRNTPTKLRFETLFLFLYTPRWEHWVKTGEWDMSLPYIYVDEEGEIRREKGEGSEPMRGER